MKKIVSLVLLAAGLLLTNSNAKAQVKIGYVSLAEFLPSMPEYKKADTSMQDYRNALAQNYEDMKKELNQQDSILASKDTLRYTKAQLELKRKTFGELYLKVQSYQQQAQDQLQQKQQELIAPVQKKALDAIQAVAKENGYTYVLQKEALYAYPLAEDILPLVKKKLGIR
ncbi:MAG TPA: OmpH family outer membrane protein [Puia sp.]|jgi:outer membrane protein|nr:OmpH family outer membrane protein [Puia sp.]